MEFDKSKIYTVLNADELKLGSKVYVADSLEALQSYVEDNDKNVFISIFHADFHNEFITLFPEQW